jgi:hypothetical protein
LACVDEGNTLFSNWANQSYGKIVAKRYLNLYDCGDWKQSFQKNIKSEGSVVKYIEKTSTSVFIGATLDIASFQELESADGMKRRFLTYLCKGFARTIYFPQSPHCPEFEDLFEKFGRLARFAGELTFDESGKEEWVRIQKRNRKNLIEIPESGSSLRELL